MMESRCALPKVGRDMLMCEIWDHRETAKPGRNARVNTCQLGSGCRKLQSTREIGSLVSVMTLQPGRAWEYRIYQQRRWHASLFLVAPDEDLARCEDSTYTLS